MEIAVKSKGVLKKLGYVCKRHLRNEGQAGQKAQALVLLTW